MHRDECQSCPLTSKEGQDAVIDATIQATYLDPRSPNSLRAIDSMLLAWIKADYKRVGRRRSKPFNGWIAPDEAENGQPAGGTRPATSNGRRNLRFSHPAASEVHPLAGSKP